MLLNSPNWLRNGAVLVQRGGSKPKKQASNSVVASKSLLLIVSMGLHTQKLIKTDGLPIAESTQLHSLKRLRVAISKGHSILTNPKNHTDLYSRYLKPN